MKQNRNSRRINEQAREKLANILLLDIADPDLALVTVTGAEVATDKSFMRVYVSCAADRYERVMAALSRAKGRIRTLFSHSVNWRRTPEIEFVIDTSADQAEEIARALKNIPPTLSVEKGEDGYPIEESSSSDDE